jgi:hypothetical protein
MSLGMARVYDPTSGSRRGIAGAGGGRRGQACAFYVVFLMGFFAVLSKSFSLE